MSGEVTPPYIQDVAHTWLLPSPGVPLVHLGMVFVGTPYGQNPQILVTDGIGGSPYGPGTLAGTDGSRQPVEAELITARNLGSRLARVAGRLKDLRVPQ